MLHENTTTDQAKLEYDRCFIPKPKHVDRVLPVSPSDPTYAKNDDHDAFLYHQWNNKTRHPFKSDTHSNLNNHDDGTNVATQTPFILR